MLNLIALAAAVTWEGHGSSEEEIVMVKYARCNALLSLALDANGDGCRYLAKADTEQGVVDDMSKHMADIHQVDAGELAENIKASTHTTRK